MVTKETTKHHKPAERRQSEKKKKYSYSKGKMLPYQSIIPFMHTYIYPLIHTHTCASFLFRVYKAASHAFKKLLNFKTTAETSCQLGEKCA